MQRVLKNVLVGTTLGAMFFGHITSDSPIGLQLVPDAQAIIGLPFTPLSFAGVARRTAYRTVAVTSAAAATSAATAQAEAAQQQAAAAQEQAAAAQRAAAAPPPPPAPAPAAGGQPLPLGTVVNTLPAGCISTPVGGQTYFYCGGNFYRAAFQGNNLIYVTAQP